MLVVVAELAVNIFSRSEMIVLVAVIISSVIVCSSSVMIVV